VKPYEGENVIGHSREVSTPENTNTFASLSVFRLSLLYVRLGRLQRRGPPSAWKADGPVCPLPTMARTNNRRHQQKGQQSSQTPSNWGSGKGKGKDKKKPTPAKANVFSSKKKLAPAFARNGPKQQGKQHRLQAKERGGGAKKVVGRQKEFRFHLLSINSPSNSYQKAPWKPSAARPLTTNNVELETSGAPTLESSKLQSTLLSPPRDHSASGTGRRRGFRRPCWISLTRSSTSSGPLFGSPRWKFRPGTELSGRCRGLPPSSTWGRKFSRLGTYKVVADTFYAH
jgi:hypothetical protein